MSLILRRNKGSKLTTEELDGNFTYLEGISGGELSTYRTITDANDGETLLATDRTVFVHCSYQQINLTMPDPTTSGGRYITFIRTDSFFEGTCILYGDFRTPPTTSDDSFFLWIDPLTVVSDGNHWYIIAPLN